MKLLYCWRCKAERPMLDDAEWARVQPLLVECTLSAKRQRDENGWSLTNTPFTVIFAPAFDEYERLTGFRESSHAALWHHQLSRYGPPCHRCGRPLRTPQARLCGACMTPRKPT